MKKKLYYDQEDSGEFYWISETPKTIRIEWVEKLSCNGEPLDQNVAWDKKFTVEKRNSGTHCLVSNDEDGILLYPYRNGQPFYLEPAKLEHVESEIHSCKKWGVSSDYYENLKQFIL